MSLFQNGKNLLEVGPERHNKTSESFIAGILQHAAELTVFLNPLTNSYTRFGEFEAPRYISWSHQNRSPLVRIPSATGEFSRMELRSPDCASNPYLAFTLLIHAGLDGIAQNTALPQPCNENLFHAPEAVLRTYEALPGDLGKAIAQARDSAFIAHNLPARTLDAYLSIKQQEWDRYNAANDKPQAEQDMYFEQY